MDQPLYVQIFDTTETIQKQSLDELLDTNGIEIRVVSVHTAAAISGEEGCIRYHWVTVVFEKLR